MNCQFLLFIIQYLKFCLIKEWAPLGCKIVQNLLSSVDVFYPPSAHNDAVKAIGTIYTSFFFSVHFFPDSLGGCVLIIKQHRAVCDYAGRDVCCTDCCCGTGMRMCYFKASTGQPMVFQEFMS